MLIRMVLGCHKSKINRAPLMDQGPFSSIKLRSLGLLKWIMQWFPSLPTSAMMSRRFHALLINRCKVSIEKHLMSSSVPTRHCCQNILLFSNSPVSKGMIGPLLLSVWVVEQERSQGQYEDYFLHHWTHQNHLWLSNCTLLIEGEHSSFPCAQKILPTLEARKS